MGRNKKPNNLKFIEGDRSRLGVQKNDAPPIGTPEPPGDLHPDSRDEWDRIVGILVKQGRVEQLDRAMLVVYCDAVRIERELAKRLDAEGYTTVSARGGLVPHPLTLVQSRYAKLAVSLADRFGLNTKHRQGLDPAQHEPDDRDKRLLG